LNAVTAGIGWFAVNSVSGALALSVLPKLLGWPSLDPVIALVVIAVAQILIALIGHNMVHQFERYAFPFLAVVFALAAGVILAKTNTNIGFNTKAPVAFGGESGAFIIGAMAAFGYAIGWNPFASDYSRYLPKSSNPWKVGLAAGLGVFISCAVLEVAGAGLATFASSKGLFANPTAQFVDPLPKVLAVLTTLAIALGAVAANVLNIYSSAMSFLTLGIRLGIKQRRAIVAGVAGVAGFGFAVLALLNNLAETYTNFLLLIAYWITPYLAVVLTDYWLRHGEYDETRFFDTNHRPVRGAVAMLAGIAASVPFWNQTLYVGWVPFHYPQLGDLSFIVGFIVAAVVYLVLYRLAGRRTAIAR
jgi:purine-cytosine permease-like protein